MFRTAFLVGAGGVILAALLAGMPSTFSWWAGPEADITGLWDLWFAAEHLPHGLETELTRFPQGETIAPAILGEWPLVKLLVASLGVERAWSVLLALRLLVAGSGAALLLSRWGLHPAGAVLFALSPVFLSSAATGQLAPGALAWLPWGILALLDGPRPLLRGLGAAWVFVCHPAAAPLGLVAILLAQRRALAQPSTLVALGLGFLAWHQVGNLVGFDLVRSVYLPEVTLLPGLELATWAPVVLALWGVFSIGVAWCAARHRITLLLLALPLAGTWPSFSPLPAVLLDSADGPVLAYPPDPVDPTTLYSQTHHGKPTSAGRFAPPVEGFTQLVAQEGWSPNGLRGWATQQGFSILVANPNTLSGRAPAVALLLGGAVSQLRSPRPWPEVPQRSATDDLLFEPVPAPSGEGDPHPTEATWQHPDLGWVLDPALLDRAELHVRVFTSEDGRIYTPLPGPPVAHSMTSLGLSHRPDGALEISGIVRRATWRRLGLGRSKSGVNTLTSLTTPDLQQWGVRRYTLNAPARIVDPEIQHTPSGPALVAWTTDRLAKGGGIDPVLFPEPHEVIWAPLSENGLLEQHSILFSGERLADPVRVQDLLYATQLNLVPRTSTRIVIAQDQGSGFEEVGEISGLSVPYVWQDGETYRMLAHQPVLHGATRVVELFSPDGIQWGEPVGLVGLDGNPRCESPVGTRFQGKLLVVCSHQVRAHRSSAPSRPPKRRNR